MLGLAMGGSSHEQHKGHQDDNDEEAAEGDFHSYWSKGGIIWSSHK